MKFVIPSYSRANSVVTARWLKSASIVVRESQAEEYRKHNDNDVIAIPDELDGNISRARNAVLNRFEGEDVVMLDDDVRRVGYHEDGEMVWVDEGHFLDFCENMFQMAKDAGTVLWGMNVQSDKKFYREYSPFSFVSVTLAPVCGIVNTEGFRYDERLPLKDDYDFFLQVIAVKRRVLRCNKWFYQCGHITTPGGLAGVRTSKVEEKQAKLFQQKWGERIVQINRVTQGGNRTINPVVRVPIRGI